MMDVLAKESKHLLISFIGPSGQKNSECFDIAKPFLEKEGFSVYRMDVLYQLRLWQDEMNRHFDHRPKPDPDNPAVLKLGRFPRTYPSDPVKHQLDQNMLSSILETFKWKLADPLADEVRIMRKSNPYRNIAFVNTDCGNGTWQTLKNAGFVFVRIHGKPDSISKIDWKTRSDQYIEADYEIHAKRNLPTMLLEVLARIIIKTKKGQ